MKTSCYDVEVSDDFLRYAFVSEGPKGRIRKLIRFRPIRIGAVTCFNLAFGDVDKGGDINDIVTSNNNDAQKILITVAKTVIFFTDIYPDELIYVEGSTASRTRLYQMGINRFWYEMKLCSKFLGMC